MKILSPTQIDLFHCNGYLKIPELLEEKYVLKIQNEIWEELKEAFGIEKSNRKTWTTPLFSPRKTKISPTNKALINSKFRAIIDDLIGAANWTEPKSWGGFLVNFPNKEGVEWHLNHKLWHWDYELFRLFELKGLLIFSFFAEVLPKGGGTLVVSGSHKTLEKYYQKLSIFQRNWKHGQQRKHFMKTHPYFSQLTDSSISTEQKIDQFMNKETMVDGIPLQVIELTGAPGDVVFCHPRTIHAPANLNLNSSPRIMRSKFLW